MTSVLGIVDSLACRARVMATASLAFARWPVFSRTSYAMVKGLKAQGIRPATVIDVGANIGQFTVACSELLRPQVVHAFEPQTAAFGRLNRAVARYPYVATHHVALGAEHADRAELHINTHHQSSSLLELATTHRTAFPGAANVASETVPVERLDVVLSGHYLPAPILLKIDTQGYEALVLAGAELLLDQVQWVIAEASFRPMYEGEVVFRDLCQTLESVGFQFLRPVGQLNHPATGEYLQIDTLFARGG